MLDMKMLKKLMDEKEIRNIKELSIKSSIPYTTLIHIFSGNDLLASTLIELAKFFEVTLDELVNKDYELVTYTAGSIIKHKSTNIYDITAKKMAVSFANYVFK